jgi:hypothetical protein
MAAVMVAVSLFSFSFFPFYLLSLPSPLPRRLSRGEGEDERKHSHAIQGGQEGEGGADRGGGRPIVSSSHPPELIDLTLQW